MHIAADDPAQPALTVYYDGGCPLCRAEIGHYRNTPGSERIAFIDLRRDATTTALGPDLECSAALRRFHVRGADGTLVSGAAAFARLWLILPRWRWLGRLITLRVLGVRPVLLVAEAAYRVSLPLRPRLARWLVRTSR